MFWTFEGQENHTTLDMNIVDFVFIEKADFVFIESVEKQ